MMFELSLYGGYSLSVFLVLVAGLLFIAIVDVEDKSYLAKLFFLFLIVGIILVPLFYQWMVAAGLDGYAFSDDRTYDEWSAEVARAWHQKRKHVGFGGDNQGYLKFTAYLYYIFGQNTLMARVTNIFFSAVCIIFVYKLARLYLSRTIAKRAALITALMPTFMFWSINHFKEPLTILSTLLTVYAGSWLTVGKKITAQKVILFVAAATVLYTLRFSAALMLVMIFFGYYYLMSITNISFLRLILGALLFAALLISVDRLTGEDTEDVTVKFEEKVGRSEGSSIGLHRDIEGSTEAIMSYAKIGSYRQLYKLPLGICFTMIIPYPPFPKIFDRRMRLPSRVLYGVNFIFVCMLAYVCIGFFHLLRRETLSSLLLYFTPFFFIMTIAIAHPGILRYRDQWIPFFALLAAIGMEHRKNHPVFILLFNIVVIIIAPVGYWILKA